MLESLKGRLVGELNWEADHKGEWNVEVTRSQRFEKLIGFRAKRLLGQLVGQMRVDTSWSNWNQLRNFEVCTAVVDLRIAWESETRDKGPCACF